MNSFKVCIVKDERCMVDEIDNGKRFVRLHRPRGNYDFAIVFNMRRNRDDATTNRFEIIMKGVLLEKIYTLCGPDAEVTISIKGKCVSGEHWSLNTPDLRVTSGPITVEGYTCKGIARVNPVSVLKSWVSDNVFGMGNLMISVKVPYPIHLEEMALMNARIMEEIFEERLDADARIMTCTLKPVKCYKSFLRAHSPVLKDMMPGAVNKKIMEELSEDGVKALLAFLYHFEQTAAMEDCNIAVELLKAAHVYKITSLETEMRDLLQL